MSQYRSFPPEPWVVREIWYSGGPDPDHTVDITDELPRNPTGKILKKELRKPYWEGRDRATV